MTNVVEQTSDQATGQENVIPTTGLDDQVLETSPENSSSEDGTGQNSQTQTDAGTTTIQPVKPAKTPWYQHRINELTRERKTAEEAEVTRRQEVDRLTAELAVARGTTVTQPNTTTAPDIDRLVQERATAQLKQQSFNDACNRVYSSGQDEFKGGEGQLAFDAALTQLGMLGTIPPEFLEAATALEGGHRVLHYLGSNLDVASELMHLPPVQLAIRMSALSANMGKSSQKPVSRTPAPITPISGAGTNDDLSKANLSTFMERRNRDAPIKR